MNKLKKYLQDRFTTLENTLTKRFWSEEIEYLRERIAEQSEIIERQSKAMLESTRITQTLTDLSASEKFGYQVLCQNDDIFMVYRLYKFAKHNQSTGNYTTFRFNLVNVKIGIRHDVCESLCSVKNNEMELDHIATVCEYKNRGLASFLLQHIITYARYSGLTAIKGTLQHGEDESMAKLRKFYTKNGFTCGEHGFFIKLQEPTKRGA
ncbi:MAG: GNAT family N-acetyltransferase [Defluviitaleaceae bacterium]|nr:GNAT family N-acetyltransferase [Defluviitaleaceae bacterium]